MNLFNFNNFFLISSFFTFHLLYSYIEKSNEMILIKLKISIKTLSTFLYKKINIHYLKQLILTIP